MNSVSESESTSDASTVYDYLEDIDIKLQEFQLQPYTGEPEVSIINTQ